MKKDKILLIYTAVLIFLGGALFFLSLDYVQNFTKTDFNITQTVGEFYGTVEKTIFDVKLIIYGDELIIPSTILIVALVVFVLQVVFMILLGSTKEVEEKLLKDVHQVNFIVLFIYLLSVIMFIILIPESINGPIKSFFIFVQMPILSDNIRYVVNFMYTASLFLVVYNALVFFKSLPESEVEEDEELYAEEFYSHLEEEEDLDK